MTEAIDLAALAMLVLLAAVLYSSGGHAGATAYLAAMSLYDVAPAVMRPTALVMNIAVAGVGSLRFGRAGALPWPLLRPLCLASAPAAFAGGMARLGPRAYLCLLGVCLVVAAAFLWMRPRLVAARPPPAAPWLAAIGAGLGLLAGLTGIGGGIFLSPVLLLSGWADPRRGSGAVAVFILLNSVCGLLGHAGSARLVPPQAGVLAAVAIMGALVGSYLGAYRLAPLALRRVHAVIVLASGSKLLLEALRL